MCNKNTIQTHICHIHVKINLSFKNKFIDYMYFIAFYPQKVKIENFS